ncbi:hypothetical protein PF003_g40089 [Phytophthora fragariae]|nr:hypothetical protein PF003_g40089 [Phytophthora fragariae]
MQKKVVRPPASYFQSSFPPAGSTNLAADMGHPASHERSQFVDLKIDCGSGRSWHFCKHCHRAYNTSKLPNGTYSLPEPKRIKGRIENFKSHLKRCEHFIAHGSSTGSSDAATANPTVGGLLCSGDGASTLSQQNPRKQTRIDDYYVGIFEGNERQLFERVILEFQADNNLPDTFIERKSTYRLLHLAHTMMIDVSPLPNRKKLGGPEAGKKLLNKTALTSVGSLCRIGVYYFRRFKLGEDTTGLYEDLHCWINDEDDTVLPLVILRRFTAIGFA